MGAPECRLENGDRGNSAGPAVLAGLLALNPRPARIRHIFMGRPAARPPGSASVCLRSRQTCSAVGKCLAPLTHCFLRIRPEPELGCRASICEAALPSGVPLALPRYGPIRGEFTGSGFGVFAGL